MSECPSPLKKVHITGAHTPSGIGVAPPTLIDVAFIIASQTTGGCMSWPAESGTILELCRGVDPRVLESLCQHVPEHCVFRSRLSHAAFIGDLQRTRLLLENGSPADLGSPLAHAVYCGHEAVSKVLIAAGADITNVLEELSGVSFQLYCRRVVPLSDAHNLIRCKLIVEMCDALRVRTTDSDETDSERADREVENACNEFHLGVNLGVPALVARHLENPGVRGDNWEWWINSDWRSSSSKDVMRLLASRPAICHVDWFEVAADLDDKQLVHDLCETIPAYNESEALFAACGVGDLVLVKALLARDGLARGSYFPPDERHDIVLFWGGLSPWGWTQPSIFIAAHHGHVDVVRHLLWWLRNKPLHSNPDQSLMAAVACGLMDEAVALIDSGVDVTVEQADCHNMHDSYLSVACDVAEVDMVRMLLNAGADPNQTFQPRDSEGYHPLFLAAGGGSDHREWKPSSSMTASEEVARREAMVGLLLSAGATSGTFGPKFWLPEKLAAAKTLIARVHSQAAATAAGSGS